MLDLKGTVAKECTADCYTTNGCFEKGLYWTEVDHSCIDENMVWGMKIQSLVQVRNLFPGI